MPECYADTLLIQTLVPTKTGYNHKHSCNEVASAMVFGKMKDSFALGIIDNDKNAIKYLNEFDVLDECEGELILWKHRAKPHFIIQICPALESWILNICEVAEIELKEFGLKDDLEGLMNITKHLGSKENEAWVNPLIKLFNEIRRSDNKTVSKLMKWVSTLKEQNYNVDLKYLVS